MFLGEIGIGCWLDFCVLDKFVILDVFLGCRGGFGIWVLLVEFV